MKKNVYKKILLGYAILGVIGFIIMNTVGVLALDKYIDSINVNIHHSRLHIILSCVYLIIYVLFYLLILIFRKTIKLPLEQIANGATQFGHGNFKYRIPVHTEDELGYVANTLNYMAEYMDQTGTYISRYISNVSHDFRSPLTSIKGYSEAMLDGTIPPEMQKKYMKVIAHEAQRLTDLTETLLSLQSFDSNRRVLNVETFDIHTIIQSTAETFEGICKERNIHLELPDPTEPLFVRADLSMIQQVLYNLLDNAIKFSKNDSSIIIGAYEKNGKVFVSVKDQGCGIPKDSLVHIWDRFYKTDTSRGKNKKGSGLGLSIVREIINTHEQTIDVISTEGIGTEFIFTLSKEKNPK